MPRESIPPELVPWLLKQEMFWVATAPLSPEGHVNASPKGVRDCFHVLSPTRVWYQDLTGSGIETISHIRENGRIMLMFMAFEGPPRIARLHGRGMIYEYGSPEYDELVLPENRRPGSRAAIVVDVQRVSTSCGYAVPYYEFKGHRQILLDYFDKRERADQADPNAHAEKGLKAYWDRENQESIDGLPGLAAAYKVERTPYCRDAMRFADTPEGGSAPERSSVKKPGNSGSGSAVAAGSGVLVKQTMGRQRMQDFIVAFALGLAAAAIYVQVMSAL
ncbi:hypothetical protein GY45DRAFT_1338926 [Cubamyces sp. BRFM 1775]|nr:hypothetical protein GY45DRAFT_1338926 [Cubamyces sp. BRFM 1775]